MMLLIVSSAVVVLFCVYIGWQLIKSKLDWPGLAACGLMLFLIAVMGGLCFLVGLGFIL